VYYSRQPELPDCANFRFFCIFLFERFLKITNLAQILEILSFFTRKIKYQFWLKITWAKFWVSFFYKIIWSPCDRTVLWHREQWKLSFNWFIFFWVVAMHFMYIMPIEISKLQSTSFSGLISRKHDVLSTRRSSLIFPRFDLNLFTLAQPLNRGLNQAPEAGSQKNELRRSSKFELRWVPFSCWNMFYILHKRASVGWRFSYASTRIFFGPGLSLAEFSLALINKSAVTLVADHRFK
jgi:hypothetical protein